MAIKLRRGTFQHVEAELYAFPETKKEILRLRNDILLSSPEPNRIGGGRSNLPSDVVGLAVSRLTGHKRLNTLEDIKNAIEGVYGGLTDNKQNLIKLKYWTKPQTLTWDGIAMELHVSRRQAIRWRDEIVFSIAIAVGWK